MGLAFSLLAFAMAFLGAMRSLGWGIAALLTTGYFYGIFRARYLDGFSHFIFDAAALGLYLSHFNKVGFPRGAQSQALCRWAILLIVWPVITLCMFVLYPQPPLVQLVGLRAACWFLPFLLMGVVAKSTDLTVIARTLAGLNGVVLLFAVGEYVLGLELFYPRNTVTELLYRSSDVADGQYRLPGTFQNAAGYGGAMIASLPFLLGRWRVDGIYFLEQALLIGGSIAGAIGIFLCGSRSPVMLLFGLGLVVAYELRHKVKYLLPLIATVSVVFLVVSGNQRMQRFSSLGDSELVVNRVSGSANVGIIDIVMEHPLGAGLGSAFGTSVPGFLADGMVEQIGVENEYARIGVEQGLVGIFLWLGFLGWLLSKRLVKPRGGWAFSLKIMYCAVIGFWLTGFIGCGMFTAVPHSAMLLFMMGCLGRSAVGLPAFRPKAPVPGTRERRQFLPTPRPMAASPEAR